MALWTVSIGSMFKAWGCRPTPRRADARSIAFSPLNPPGDFGPTPVAPARGEAGGMVCMTLLRILIGQQMVVVQLHGIFEYTSWLPARISHVLLVILLFAIISAGLGGILLQAFCGFRPEDVAPLKRKGMSKKFKRGIRREEIDFQPVTCIIFFLILHRIAVFDPMEIR